MKNSAVWITAPRDTGAATCTFEKRFAVSEGKAVKKATLRATAMGVYVPFLNGARVGDAVLAPGWTSYKKRVQVQTYDVTSLLAADNLLSFGVGQGWAVGYIGIYGKNHCFADRVSLLAWLDILYADGTKETVATNESWDVFTSEVTFSEIYHGETVDKTAAIVKLGRTVRAEVSAKLIPQVGEWIREQEKIHPVSAFITPKGERVIDFGQNMTGYVEVTITAPRGSRVVLHHAEVLDKDGNFYNANYRTARNEMT